MPIKVENKNLLKSLRKATREYKKATRKNLNDSAKEYKKLFPREILKDWNLKVSSAKKQLGIKKATASKLTATVFQYKKEINAISYKGTRQTKSNGLNVQFKKGEKINVRFGFINTVNGKTKPAMIRSGNIKRSGRKIPKKVAAHFPDKYKYKTLGVIGRSVGYIAENEETKRDELVFGLQIKNANKEMDDILKGD